MPVGSWRRYQHTPPAGQGPGWELIVRGHQPPGLSTPPVELNGKGVARSAAAWLLSRARLGRARGGSLRVTRYGPQREPAERGGVP